MRLPTVKTIKARLTWLDKVGDPDMLAVSLRQEMDWHVHGTEPIEQVMRHCDEICQTYGVEYIPHKDDGMFNQYGLLYLNTGESYAPTIIYDMKSKLFKIYSWGDIVEKHGKWYL